MGLPLILKNLNTFVNGADYRGRIGEFEQPKISMVTSDWRGGGMIGSVKLDHGIEPLESTLTFGSHEVALPRLLGDPRINSTRIRLVGAYQADNGSAAQAVDIFMGGRFTEIDFGKDKPGDPTEHKYKAALSYYRREVNGMEEIEIDMIAGVYRVFGIDRYAEIMAILAG